MRSAHGLGRAVDDFQEKANRTIGCSRHHVVARQPGFRILVTPTKLSTAPRTISATAAMGLPESAATLTKPTASSPTKAIAGHRRRMPGRTRRLMASDPWPGQHTPPAPPAGAWPPSLGRAPKSPWSADREAVSAVPGFILTLMRDAYAVAGAHGVRV